MRRSGWLALPILATCLVAGSSRAQSPACPEATARAGNFLDVAPWARPSDTGRYVGYYVGGGSANFRKGDPPLRDEGTWGWDYLGGCIRRRVMLDWWHGRRTQGGTGAYATDGPRPLHPPGDGH